MTPRTDRIEMLARTLGRAPAVGAGVFPAERDILDIVDVTDRRQVWLALAVLTGRLPDERTIVETTRAATLEPAALLDAARSLDTHGGRARAVVVASDRVVVDVPDPTSPLGHDRQVARRARMAGHLGQIWERDHGALRVTWDDDAQALLAVTSPGRGGPADAEQTVVVPWRSRYILPFANGSADRVARLRAVARLSGNVVGVLDAGLSAVTMAEEYPPDQTAGTAAMLTVLRHADRVAAVSPAAQIEYHGWVQTLAAIGLAGPEIVGVAPAPPPPAQPGPDVVARLRAGVLPLIAVLGCAAAPRLQATVLHAAERLWAAGREFALTLLADGPGAESDVARLVADLQRRDRPVDLITEATSELERGALEHARLAVSLTPAAAVVLDWSAALDAGTPVIVRSAGQELDALLPAGCRAVGLHDEDAVHDALRTFLDDGDVARSLTCAATQWQAPSLAGFASEVWHALRCDEPPPPA